MFIEKKAWYNNEALIRIVVMEKLLPQLDFNLFPFGGNALLCPQLRA